LNTLERLVNNIVLLLSSGFGAEIVVHLFAFVYPFIATVKCMESGSKKGDSTQDNTDWLMYWGKEGKSHNFFIC
jgi:hypothetical protein